MTVIVRESIYADLREAVLFYEEQEPGVGREYLKHMLEEIDRLTAHPGIHAKKGRFHRAVIKKYHTAIFYTLTQETLDIRRVLDQRRDPKWLRRELKRPL